MNITIPNDILEASGLTEAQLKLEIALMLYQQNKISSGKVRAWLDLSVLEFQNELAKRNLYLNYDIEDLEEDIKNLRSLGAL